MKSHVVLWSLVVLIFTSACSSLKTTPEKAIEITNKIDNKDFTIKFNYANPIRMQQIALTSEYNLTIKGDSAIAFLPYYGVAHVAPFNSSEGGIKFASNMKDYSKSMNKKGDGWNIRFKINSSEYHYNIFLSVYQNGNSTLQINSYERDPISFYGEIK